MRAVTDYRDGPRDECGVFGIYAPDHDVARLSYFALLHDFADAKADPGQAHPFPELVIPKLAEKA